MDKYIPESIEEKNYNIWIKNNYFEGKIDTDKPYFSMVIPPPNVTGSLHMGHALNNTLQDTLARYKRFRGYNVMWLPGCDHAGIATQNVVERELLKEGKKKEDIGREEFLKRVWEWKEKYGKTIMMQLRRLGSSLDWSRERFTMDEGLSNAVKEVFVRLYKEGLIYRDNYIINWCPRCLTALSDIEVVHKELDGKLYYIKYPFKDIDGFIEVATTRPETLLGDTAVAVNPEDERYKHLKEGTLIILPETGRYIPLIKDKFVDKEFGTGAVKITPAHDPNDFEAGKRHNLQIINVMNEDGTMNKNAGINGKYAGLNRFECREKIVEELKKQGLLTKIEEHKHAVGHCYRCDTIIEPYVSTQWFVKVKPLAEKAIKVVENNEIKFHPEHWKKVYFEWMYNIKDWCISRQLWWGHRIPAWYCKECGNIIVEKEAPEKCNKCGSTKLYQDEDVLDTWFSSALWPFSTLGWPEDTKDLKTFYPTSVLVTGWDILFFWVARMIMMGMKFMKKPPFYNVVINSLVGDAEGKKMSKSKGNVVDPLDLIKNYSADSLRFTLVSLETQTRYIAFSEERVKGYHNFMNKIWNASKFVIDNLKDFKKTNIKSEDLKLSEKWILKELNKVIKRITFNFENYKFSDTALTLYEFFWHKFCDWYIEISKIELNRPNNDYKIITKNVLYKILKSSLILLHPLIPFITEEIYQNLPFKKKSIMEEDWVEENNEYNEFEVSDMEFLQQIIYHIRNLRGELAISPGKKVKVNLKIKHKYENIITNNIEILKTLSKVEAVNFKGKEDKIVGKEVPNIGFIGIDIRGVVDIDEEKNNLIKKIKKMESLIISIENKLQNESFITKAPKKVVEDEKEKIKRYKEEKQKLGDILKMFET